jgi:predicted protein tyrosine phosphatase
MGNPIGMKTMTTYPGNQWRPTQVRVSSLARAEELSKDWADRVVSLVAPDTELPKFSTFHLSIPMHDTEVITDMWSPKIQDIQKVLDFCPPHSNIVVHCFAGVSRSSAVGISLLVRDGFSIVEAVDQVHVYSPNMAPNKLILRHMDTLLHRQGTLVAGVLTAVSMLPKDLILWCAECNIHFKDEDGHDCPSGSWQT